ncbi:MAG TPA: hypothetical protein VJU61_29160 [Polyangiaceae bacterium]|nr:hypothetical protein [Polyangiaceae bacterium]
MYVLKELCVGLVTALVTAAGLFTLQLWYSSYLDVAVIHGNLSNLPMDAKLEAVRKEEHTKLTTGPLPIDKAMEVLAQRGRNAFPKLAARPSDDLSAMSGWVRKPNFKPYVPRRAADATPEERHAQ